MNLALVQQTKSSKRKSPRRCSNRMLMEKKNKVQFVIQSL